MFVLPGLIGNTQRNSFDAAAAGGGPSPFDVSYITNFQSGTDAASYTAASLNIGAADADRKIAAAVFYGKANPAAGFTSLKITNIDGAGATGEVTLALVTAADVTHDTGTASYRCAWYEGSVPSGTTADAVLALAATVVRCSMVFYRAISATSSAGSAASNAASPGLSRTITIPTDGVGLYYAVNPDLAWDAWTNATDTDLASTIVEGNFRHTAARRTTAGSTTVTANHTGNSAFNVGAAFAYEPA